MILIHGRGAGAQDILGLGLAITAGLDGIALIAPQAAGNSWYPARFLEPPERNEPALSSALGVIDERVSEAVRSGLPRERIVLAGFSQGACLCLEYAARNPRRYGAVFGLSGALIGPLGAARPAGDLAGTAVYLGCSDADPFIPIEHVRGSAATLERMGAKVTASIFPGMGHTVNEEERAALHERLQAVLGTGV